MIETPRLLLIPATPHLLTAELQDRDSFAIAIEADLPDTWPPEHLDADALRHSLTALTQATTDLDWHLHYFARKPDTDGMRKVLVGAGGFTGPPGDDGIVEIGYAIVADARRRGYAAEAVRGLLRRAFVDARVDRVIAHTLPDLTPSIGVLRKCGFRDVGPGAEAGTICYALRRDAYVAE